MHFQSVRIESLGYTLPDEAVTSEELEERLRPLYERINLPFGRLELMTGVRERRFFPAGTRPSDIAARAGEAALARCGFGRDRIGAIVHTSVCRDFVEPATASVVHNHLRLPRECMLFDLSNACLGFLNGMVMLGNMIESGQIEAGILVSGEDGRELVETTIAALNADTSVTRKSMKGSFASLTIGSAGVAAVLCHERLATSPDRRKLRGGVVRCATRHNNLCQGDTTSSGGTLMNTDSEELLRQGVELAAETWQEMCRKMNWKPDGTPKVNPDTDRVPARQVLKFIGHQVGAAHRRALFQRLGLDLSRDYSTFERLGNVGSAAAPITLARAEEDGFIVPGETVALLGIGSGINCMMLAVDW